MRHSFLCIIILISLVFPALGQQLKDSEDISEISAKTSGMEKYEGYFNFYWDQKTGKIWLEIDKFDTEILYINSLAAGIGSNDIGLDRAQLGGTRIVVFQKVGPKILMIQPNYSYRAESDNPYERKAVELAFARSTIWAFEAAAQTGNSVLVDASKFLMRDAHNIAGSLRRSNQGTFRLEDSKSAVFLPRTKNFPMNSEFEVTLTFASDNPGGYVRQVTPTPNYVTVRQHHSFVRLPDDKYEKRKFDPRVSIFGITYQDYATPISEPLKKRFISRHRLEKKDPNSRISEAVDPIIYYVDNGTPEPIRSALVDGAQWWNQAFKAIGYKDAFQVKILPEGADPMDIRYNMINWVHRSTRGWSYGSSVTDPRTGEILKGHVTLGSLRVRQDFLIAEALLSPYKHGTTVPEVMEEMALARIRQLSVHEVGHTLGFGHNYASSANNRASVMDYPHPLIKLDAIGNIDLSEAYDTGVGAWDIVTVAYGYQDFPDGADEDTELENIINDAYNDGLFYIADRDSRGAGSAHPVSHLWDNGKNSLDELERVLKIRKAGLDRFSESNIRKNTPLAALEEKLVPLYLFHRYQTEAAAKTLGGFDYSYKLRGDGLKMGQIMPPEDQRRALELLLKTIDIEVLRLDERIINLILPRPPGYGQTRELFNGRTGLTFDPLTAAESAANMTVGFILNHQRAARLIEYNARDKKYPGLVEVIDKVLAKTIKSDPGMGLDAEINRVVNNVVLHDLMSLAANQSASYQVRAIALLKLDELKKWLKVELKETMDAGQKAHFLQSATEIGHFQKNPEKFYFTRPMQIPAGSPIGINDEIIKK